jgi:hydrogenase maturation protein HypF
VTEPARTEEARRLRLLVHGAVQGVGFRPFVFRLAHELGLSGFVENSPQGVTIEVEGGEGPIAAFQWRLRSEKPPLAVIHGLEVDERPPVGVPGFEIRASAATGERTALVLPDVATCSDCLAEVFDPTDRRHRYPFTNCTNCGPRYSIVCDLPYDRARTTMATFPMCRSCRLEYMDPVDRRFHAEPNACPVCGPHLALLGPGGAPGPERDAALQSAAAAIRAGLVVAVKGLGGYHLLCDARDEEAVRRLRARKRREAKPLAVMVPTLGEARRHASVSELEERLLSSPAAPIVLLERRETRLAPSVAPDNPYLGLMLPYTPLHHLLLAELAFPVVATSGNLSDEPLCSGEAEAVSRLARVADFFLTHDRAIAHPVDDSVVRVVAGRELVLRRARGYAPFPVACARPLPSILAVGGHMKNAVAVSSGTRIFVGPHVGDLDTEGAQRAFDRTVETLGRLYAPAPVAVACDAHPDYASTRLARRRHEAPLEVQHHHAHVLACLADNETDPPALGFAWDGTGYGLDRTIWGGEALDVTPTGFTRFAWLHPFPLPGGDRAVREPRRSALGALYAARPAAAESLALFAPIDRALLLAMIRRGTNTVLTSSAGRLFDAVAALAGLVPVAQFEGQAAMALEFALQGLSGDDRYEFELSAATPADQAEEPASGPAAGAWTLDWRPMLRAVARDLAQGAAPGPVSLRFHNTLVEMMVAAAQRSGRETVALSGGCFQNRYLTERAVRRLRESGFRPLWHRRLPPGDGGLAVGQVLAAAQRLAATEGS